MAKVHVGLGGLVADADQGAEFIGLDGIHQSSPAPAAPDGGLSMIISVAWAWLCVLPVIIELRKG